MDTRFLTGLGQRYPIAENAEIGLAKRQAQVLAHEAGFNETLSGQLAIVVAELGTNLLKHGGGGELLLSRLRDGERAGVEVLACDKGPGISSVSMGMLDGYSTRGTLGVGLGAVSRLAHHVDVFSRAGQGTVVMARFWRDGVQAPLPYALPACGAVAVPKAGQDVSGDVWAVREVDGVHMLMVADGLGYGAQAALTAAEALRAFQTTNSTVPVDVLTMMHGVLKHTRGAVAAVAAMRPAQGVLHYAGVGNIAGLIFNPEGKRRHLMSYDGTLGYQVRTIRETTYEWTPGCWLAMHSDGLTARLDPSIHPGLSHHDPSLIAAVLYRDFHRTHDDATVLVVKHA